MSELHILRDEDGAVVVDKPPGLESTGRSLDDPGAVQFWLSRQLGRKVWAVHQLDRDTSGALVFVRKKSLVAEWQRLLGDARTHKRYLALAHGCFQGDRRSVDAPLAYDPRARRWVVRKGGKEARSEVVPLARTEDASALEVILHTGRTHQARVHLAHLGHPLFGEARYRAPPCVLHPRHALHARRIELADGRVFTAPIPDDLVALARRLGLRLE
jgi:23S rRNA-/tRNA-specific pseudouridylate synthase